MRIWNKEIGKKIIKIVYEHEPDGIGYNELKRISHYAKNTIDRWLNRLRNFEIIKQNPKYPIHMTEEAIREYRKNSLLIPDDVRRRRKNIWSEKEKRSIILILSLMALGVYKPRRYHKSKGGLLEIHNPSNPQQFFRYWGKTIHSVSSNEVVSRISTKNQDSPNKKAFLPNTKINYGNNELFGYLNLTIEEAIEIFDKLLNHNPPIIQPLKMKYKTQSEIKYTIADDLLKEFIKNCILSFNLHVNERLKYAYIYELFYDLKIEEKYPLKKEEQLRQYKEHMQIWYGTKRKRGGYFAMMKNRQNELKNGDKDKKLELRRHYKKVIEEWDKNVINLNLFDEKFENVNEKYKPLLDKYGFIVNTFLELLFPQFLKEIWKKKKLII